VLNELTSSALVDCAKFVVFFIERSVKERFYGNVRSLR